MELWAGSIMNLLKSNGISFAVLVEFTFVEKAKMSTDEA